MSPPPLHAAPPAVPGRPADLHAGVDGSSGHRSAAVTAIEMVTNTLRAGGFRKSTIDHVLPVLGYADLPPKTRKRECP